MNKKLAIFGCGGHAKSVADVVLHNQPNREIVFIDKNARPNEKIFNAPVFTTYNVDDCDVFIAIGDNRERKLLCEMHYANLICVISNTAYIGKEVRIGKGVFIAHSVHIGPLTTIDDFCVLNTSASVNHECHIGKATTVAPGALLCGNVHVGRYAWVGAGAIVRQQLTISNDVMIGCGAVVVENCDDSGTYLGIPAKINK